MPTLRFFTQKSLFDVEKNPQKKIIYLHIDVI